MSRKIFTQGQKKAIEKFNQMIKEGDLFFEKVDCLCGHNVFIKISNQDRYGLEQRVVLCQKCGLMMSNPRLTDQSYKIFYSTDLYREIYLERDFLKDGERNLKSDYGKFILNHLYPFIKTSKGLSVLEFGCGGGWNLIHFLKIGHKVTGYDYSPGLTRLGRTHKLDLREGTIGDIEGKYEIIILNHVIEHFTDLVGSMRAIKKHLKPGGLMYIGVPNIDNYGFLQIQNAHVYYFTPQTFKHYMSHCGLRMVQFGTAQNIHMYGIFEIGSKNSTIFSLDSEFKRIRRTIRKRKIKEYFGRVLEQIGIKKFIKSISKKSSKD